MSETIATVARAREHLKAGDTETAYGLFVAVSLAHGSQPEVVAGLALCLGRLGRYVEGDGQWSHLSQFMPQAYSCEYQLKHVECLIFMGNLVGAKALLRKVSSNYVDNGLKLKLIRRIAALEERENCPKRHDAEVAEIQGAPGTVYAAGAVGIVSAKAVLRARYADLIADRTSTPTPLAFRSVVVVTYGRTGSTLLQGLLNTIDGMRFLGENEGAFFHLFEYVKTIERLSCRTNVDLPSSPFFGAGTLDTVSAKEAARAAINAYFASARQNASTGCIGFKDVRYIDHPGRLSAYLSFLEEMFEMPAFVFLWRDHAEVLRSGWWKQKDRIKAAATLETIEKQAEEFASDRSNCFFLTYSDLNTQNSKLRSLFTFLGAAFDPDRVGAVMSIPHSYNPERLEIREMFENARLGSGV